MNENIKKYLPELLEKTKKEQLILIDEKEIPYGISLKLGRAEESIKLNIYYSKKKGISKVIQSKKDNPLKPLLSEIIGAENSIKKPENQQDKIAHKWTRWIGSDESGKGDFFGPLVACAFYCDRKMESELRQWKIDDSKKIKDKEIITIAEKILQKYRNNSKILILNPVKYNQLYNKFRQQNKKLNELLAWMHSRLILDLQKGKQVDGILIDKFANDYVIKNSLKEMKKQNIMQMHKAESDIAVATASVLARYFFLKKMEEMDKKFGMKFPKGATKKVIEIGNQFKNKFGINRMSEVAKTHFKTFEQIRLMKEKK